MRTRHPGCGQPWWRDVHHDGDGEPRAGRRRVLADARRFYFLVGVLFLYSGKGKLFDDDGHAPPALKKQFEGTFIETIPGVDTAWVIIGVLELAIFALMALSLVRGEFLPYRTKPLLVVALSLALLTFACLSFGQTSTGNNEGTASLYTYFASTAVILLLVLQLPPNGPLGARRP